MKVLVACEYSGIVREAFAAKGHDAWSCDLLPTDIPGNHYQGDVKDILKEGWDLMIAHPPCTYLSNSGVMWLHRQEGRWEKMKEGALFFKSLFNTDIKKIAVENPVMHKYAKEIIGSNFTQSVQPYQFGHAEQKRTCLWLKGLPPLQDTDNVKDHMMTLTKQERQRLHYLPPSKDRWKIRSTTYKGIAQAMANQWGGNTK